MKVVIQRVTNASVEITHKIKSKINKGLLVLVGFENDDSQKDIEWICRKIVNARIFYNEKQVKNLSLIDVGGDILLISQFTLHASTKKGHRPSYSKAAKAEIAEPLYEKLIKQLENDLGKQIKTGEFGAYMKVSLLNDGPVTIIIDSKNKI